MFRKVRLRTFLLFITKGLLNKGYIPLLYTDNNYELSNKAYMNVGYEDKGILINFFVQKKKIKSKKKL